MIAIPEQATAILTMLAALYGVVAWFRIGGLKRERDWYINRQYELEEEIARLTPDENQFVFHWTMPTQTQKVSELLEWLVANKSEKVAYRINVDASWFHTAGGPYHTADVWIADPALALLFKLQFGGMQ